jgi:hypothetical protein
VVSWELVVDVWAKTMKVLLGRHTNLHGNSSTWVNVTTYLDIRINTDELTAGVSRLGPG